MSDDTVAKFVPSMVKGCYVSTDDRYRIELHRAGYCEHVATKCVRHYDVFVSGTPTMIGQALTIADAERRYL